MYDDLISSNDPHDVLQIYVLHYLYKGFLFKQMIIKLEMHCTAFDCVDGTYISFII